MGHVVGERIVLREYQIEDLPYARAWANDPAATEMLSSSFLMPRTYDMTENYYRSVLSGSNPGYHFVIAHRESQTYIGQIDLTDVNQVNRCASLGIVIGAPKERGQGYGREAIALLLGYAFLEANLHRIELMVHAGNLRAIKCYEACGFQREGVRRESHFGHGKYHDIVQMGILRPEWEAACQ